MSAPGAHCLVTAMRLAIEFSHSGKVCLNICARNPRLLRAHADALIRQGRHAEAESFVRKELNRQWSDELILLYGEIKDGRSLCHVAAGGTLAQGQAE